MHWFERDVIIREQLESFAKSLSRRVQEKQREREEGTRGFQPELDAMSFASSTDTLRDTVLMLMRRETCTTRNGQGLTHNAARAAISVQPRAINNERDELNESRPPCSIIMQIFGAV